MKRSLTPSQRVGIAVGSLIGLAAVMTSCASATQPGGALPDDVLVDQETCDRNRAAGTITYISGYGYSSSAGQMDVFMAEELGYFDALCLDVEINASGANGQQLVSAGQAQFTALGSASDVMLSAANSKNLTAIATYGNTSPFAITTNEAVRSLKDLEGKRLGYFINLTPVSMAMLDAAGVDMSKVELIKMTSYDPTVVTRGQVDGIVGYASGQPKQLEALGLPHNVFLPSDFGLNTTYNVLEVNSQFLDEHRDVVADFMRADLKALQYCLDEPERCIDTMAKLAAESGQGAAFPKEQLERTWSVESQYVRDNEIGPLGVHTEEQWQPEYDIVLEYAGVRDLPALSAMMETDLVAELYDEAGALLWPSR